MTKKPFELGFRMPAEWEKHDATWLAWPHNAEDWPGKFQPIPYVYAEFVKHLAAVEHVHLLVQNEAAEKRAKQILTRAGAAIANVSFHRWPTDRVWTRDSGPIFVRNAADEVAITDWHFNAWAKYENWRHDDELPARAAELLKLKRWQPSVTKTDGSVHRLVLEGGSIDTNGQGVLLTTEECLLSKVQERNPGVSREELERAFHDYLGIEQVIWLNRGVAGDDTHGHVDDITRFVAADTILTVVEANRSDENWEPLQENLERLHAARNQEGRAFKVVTLPMPAPVSYDGQRLPASYGNFYLANGLVLVPTFNDPQDRHALNTLAEVFPERKVIGIYCGDFIWGLGALHCASQQQPAGKQETGGAR